MLDEGEPADSERGMANGGPLAAVFFHNLVEDSLDFELPAELAEAVARLMAGHEDEIERWADLFGLS